jgi:O-antigen ligase
LQVWAIGLRIAADHPVTGVGPDAFGVAFPAYSTPRFRTEFGPFTVANGAHNVFVNTLADLGVVGLAAFLAVLVVGGVRIARTWRRLPADTEDRLLLAGIAAALVAYVVQACANMQELSLSTCFWALLGLAVALSAPATGTAPTAGRA